MAIPEDRMSTTVAQADWVEPDERNRALTEDYELGPVGLNDTTFGVNYQVWHLTWDFATGDFTATPETVGAPQVVLNAAGVTQCSLAFDNNGHINIAYSIGAATYLYWYDTVAVGWLVTQLPSATFCPTLTLDDKRQTQTDANDILLWWTEQQPDDTYNLYRAQQRDRFDPLVPKEMAVGVFPYIYKLGMNKGLRLQIGLSDSIL